MNWLAILAFLASIPAANWLIGNVGACVPGGPCFVPVGLGLMAPSGVFAIGVALVFRDAVHEAFGWRGAMLAILVGAAMSWFIAPAVAIASAVAFLVAEIADLLVYAPLRRRALGWAVLLSGMAGAVIDSAVFLWLAFGSLDFLAGQVVGKAWASLAAVPLIYGWRRCST
jgi:uncharacterized PurR-regulated membrane protein YhhQ (DUF165 family)